VNQVIKTNSKGFTLIELLVVIAIIGILSTIAMTSLNGARKKAADASFRSSVASVQAVAVLCCDSTASTTPLRIATSTPAVAPGTAICTDTSVAGNYPPSSAIGTTITVTQCNGGGFTIVMNKPTGFAGNLSTGTCNETACTFA
jgi:prepilin-type N-terminal cleavage/methylation domain-containing protein